MTSISSEETILSIVAASPDHQVHGKKRIQKITFLCKYSDDSIAARFHIRHFGVFSPEIADSLEFLCIFGDLTTRDEQVGPNRYFTTVFSLGRKPAHAPLPQIATITKILADYSTPILEVASTIAFYVKDGLTESDAVRETKRIKPEISTETRIQTSKSLLKKLALLSAVDHGQRPKNP